MTALERREEIAKYISDVRKTTTNELAQRYHVSPRTITTDILHLSCIYSIESLPGKYGGIHAMEGWYISKRYMTPQQETLLRNLSKGLQPNDKQLMDEILLAFARPKVERNY